MNVTTNSCICCYVIPDDLQIRYKITLGGTLLAFLGIMANFVIMVVFNRAYQRSTTNSILLTCLAAFDNGVLISFCLLYSVQIISEYRKASTIYRWWAILAPYMFPFSRMFQMIAGYIVLVATLDRCIVLIWPKVAVQHFTIHRMKITMVGIAIFCFGYNFTRFWEVATMYEQNCTEITKEASITRGHLLKNDIYRRVYSVWLSNLLQIVLPFLILLILTVILVLNFHKSNSNPTNALEEDNPVNLIPPPPPSIGGCSSTNSRKRRITEPTIKQKRKMLKDTTRVLVVLVFSYLIFNSLSFAVTMSEFIERISGKQLFDNTFYNISVSVINLCAVTNSAIRLFNYLIFNQDFRQKTVIYLCENCSLLRKSQSPVHRLHDETDNTLEIVTLVPSSPNGQIETLDNENVEEVIDDITSRHNDPTSIQKSVQNQLNRMSHECLI